MLEKIIFCLFLPVFAVLNLVSCSADKVVAALKQAGDNRAELEKVLSYFESTGD